MSTTEQTMDQMSAMMNPEPQKEHKWLRKLLGDWTFESEVSEAGKPSDKCAGAESVRALGDLWVVGEGTGDMPGGGTAKTVLTLGYDIQKKRFVGTWVGSMMTNLWVYDGYLDENSNKLTLESEGPDMSGSGKSARYRDIIEFASDDHRILRSETLGEDGKWTQFMVMHYRRRK